MGVIIERESTNRHRTSDNRVGRDSRDSHDQRVSSGRDYDRPSTNKTSKTSITKITPLTENQKSSSSINSSPVRKSSSRSLQRSRSEDGGMFSWINIKCILFFIFLFSAVTLGFATYLFAGRIMDQMKVNALSKPSITATTEITTAEITTAGMTTSETTAAVTTAATTAAATTAAETTT